MSSQSAPSKYPRMRACRSASAKREAWVPCLLVRQGGGRLHPCHGPLRQGSSCRDDAEMEATDSQAINVRPRSGEKQPVVRIRMEATGVGGQRVTVIVIRVDCDRDQQHVGRTAEFGLQPGQVGTLQGTAVGAARVKEIHAGHRAERFGARDDATLRSVSAKSGTVPYTGISAVARRLAFDQTTAPALATAATRTASSTVLARHNIIIISRPSSSRPSCRLMSSRCRSSNGGAFDPISGARSCGGAASHQP